MRITKIAVSKLFNNLDIKVDLPNKSKVNILFGPNGIGKTTVLSMIDALFNLRYRVFDEIPFSKFTIHMDNGVSLELQKKVLPDKNLDIYSQGYSRGIHSDLQLSFNDGESHTTVDFMKVSPILGRVPTWFRQLESDLWLDVRTRARYSTKELVARYPRLTHLQEGAVKQEERDRIEAIRKLLALNKTYFIDTLRLRTNNPQVSGPQANTEVEELKPIVSVEVCSKKLIEKIRRVSLEYATISQTLERTFPQRLIKHISRYKRMPNLLVKLNALEEYRKELLELGLSEPESVTVVPLKSVSKRFTNVLSLYSEDTITKLGVYKDLYKKVKLFMELIGKRFNAKEMKISVLNGIQFSSGGAAIPLSRLSSGEQHELVMIYNLLFEIPGETNVLIDEPEISLHVCWQEEYLKDLGAIGNLIGHNFIVATHSPSIINENWDYATELKNV